MTGQILIYGLMSLNDNVCMAEVTFTTYLFKTSHDQVNKNFMNIRHYYRCHNIGFVGSSGNKKVFL